MTTMLPDTTFERFTAQVEKNARRRLGTETVTRLDHIRHDECAGYISADDAAAMRRAVLAHMTKESVS